MFHHGSEVRRRANRTAALTTVGFVSRLKQPLDPLRILALVDMWRGVSALVSDAGCSVLPMVAAAIRGESSSALTYEGKMIPMKSGDADRLFSSWRNAMYV